jgi:hypothetical protein
MEQITIVRKRNRVWPLVLAVLVVALIVVAALYLIGSTPETTAFFESALPPVDASFAAAAGPA